MGRRIHVRNHKLKLREKYFINRPLSFSEKFGLHRVDMESDARTRTPKESTKFLRGIFQNNGYVAGSGGATTAASVLLLALGLAARAIFV